MLAAAVVEHQPGLRELRGEYGPQRWNTELRDLGGDYPAQIVAQGDPDQFTRRVFDLAGPLSCGHLPEPADQFGELTEPPVAQPFSELFERHALQLARLDPPGPHQGSFLTGSFGGLSKRPASGRADGWSDRGESLTDRFLRPLCLFIGGLGVVDCLVNGAGLSFRDGALIVGGIGSPLERRAHSPGSLFGLGSGSLCLLRLFVGAAGLLQHSAQSGGLGQDGHRCGVRVAAWSRGAAPRTLGW